VESPKKERVAKKDEGEIYDEVGEVVVMEDMDYAKVKNKVMKSKKRVGEK
jgi:hypothetical protein